jgi:hypothetical protein
LEDLDIDGRIILKCILKKLIGMVWARFIWSRIGTNEYSNEPSGFVKGKEYLE